MKEQEYTNSNGKTFSHKVEGKVKSILYRPHTGGCFDKGRKDVKEVKSVQELYDYINTGDFFNIEQIEIKPLMVRPCGLENVLIYDPRIDWQTYIVCVKYKGVDDWMGHGYTNGMF